MTPRLRNISPVWAERDTAADKLLACGAAVLTDEELVSLISGCDVAVARQLLENLNNNLVELARISPAQMTRTAGITASKALRIVAAMELGRRHHSQADSVQVKVIGSVDIISVFRPLMRSLPYEEVWVVLLSVSKNIIEKVRISSGGTVNSPIDIKMVLKTAIDYLAAGVVVVHNHPSGDCSPSQYDIDVTRRLKNGLEMVDVKLLDHIILSDNDAFSFAQEGVIRFYFLFCLLCVFLFSLNKRKKKFICALISFSLVI